METQVENYVISPDIGERTGELALASKAFMTSTRGNLSLSPTATQWTLEVRVATNGQVASFDFVENMLRSFVDGAGSLGALSQYEQVRDGFKATIAPSELRVFGCQNRGEIQEVLLKLNFTFPIGETEDALFPAFLLLADEVFRGVFNALSSVAPLVFDQFTRENFAATASLLRSVKSALGLDETVIERGLERGLVCRAGRTSAVVSTRHFHAHAWPSAILVSPKPSVIKRPTVGYGRNGRTSVFFADRQFEHRRFILLSECDQDEHEVVFADELTS